MSLAITNVRSVCVCYKQVVFLLCSEKPLFLPSCNAKVAILNEICYAFDAFFSVEVRLFLIRFGYC